MPEIAAVVLALAALLVVRRYAVRQVAARRGRFVWAFAFPLILVPVIVVWAGLRELTSGQLAGGILLAIGAALGSVELLYLHRVSRAVSTAAPDEDLGEALTEPLANFMMVTTVGGLILVVVGGLALLAWAVLDRLN